MSVQRRGTTLFTAIVVLVATGVVVQLSLLNVNMEAAFRHHAHAVIPPAVSSSVLFAINAEFSRYGFALIGHYANNRSYFRLELNSRPTSARI